MNAGTVGDVIAKGYIWLVGALVGMAALAYFCDWVASLFCKKGRK